MWSNNNYWPGHYWAGTTVAAAVWHSSGWTGGSNEDVWRGRDVCSPRPPGHCRSTWGVQYTVHQQHPEQVLFYFWLHDKDEPYLGERARCSKSVLSRSWFRTASSSIRGQSWALRLSCCNSSTDKRTPSVDSSCSDMEQTSKSPLEVMQHSCCSTLDTNLSITPYGKTYGKHAIM